MIFMGMVHKAKSKNLKNSVQKLISMNSSLNERESFLFGGIVDLVPRTKQ